MLLFLSIVLFGLALYVVYNTWQIWIAYMHKTRGSAKEKGKLFNRPINNPIEKTSLFEALRLRVKKRKQIDDASKLPKKGRSFIVTATELKEIYLFCKLINHPLKKPPKIYGYLLEARNKR